MSRNNNSIKKESSSVYIFAGIICAFVSFACLAFAPLGLIGTIVFGYGAYINFSNSKKCRNKVDNSSCMRDVVTVTPPPPPVSHNNEPSAPIMHPSEKQSNLEDIITTSQKLYDCLVAMSIDKQVLAALDSQPEFEKAREIEISTGIDVRLAVVASTDLVKCFEGLGHRPDMNTDEGRAIGLVLARIFIPERDMWNDVTTLGMPQIGEILEGVYNMVKDNFQVSFDPDKFLLIEVLRNNDVDKDTVDRWAVLMYRYALLIAKADGYLSDKEQAWLTNIMKFSQESREPSAEVQSDDTAAGNPLEELGSLIGLSGVKSEVSNIYNLIKVQRLRVSKGLSSPDISYHCVFTGNPGTGKTTVARLVARIYKELGILSKGHLVETDRSGLVAEYVGQTAVKTNKIIDSALDGVLFIDEAYSLVQRAGENDYGHEAIATLLKRMEDNRDRLVVILAGYSDEMKTFINSNPGLHSRFNRYIHFDDYTASELTAIYEYNLAKYDYKMTPQAAAALQEVMDMAVENKDRNFGNARFVRNLFEKTLERQAKRLASSSLSTLGEAELAEITDADIRE